MGNEYDNYKEWSGRNRIFERTLEDHESRYDIDNPPCPVWMMPIVLVFGLFAVLGWALMATMGASLTQDPDYGIRPMSLTFFLWLAIVMIILQDAAQDFMESLDEV